MKLLRSKRNQKLLVRLLIALIIFTAGYLSEANSGLSQQLTELSPGTYRVASFHDGDTIDGIQNAPNIG